MESNTPVFNTGLGIESIMIWANDLTSLGPLFTHVKKEVIVVLPRRNARSISTVNNLSTVPGICYALSKCLLLLLLIVRK